MGLYNASQSWELSLLALCVWREGRNQPFRGLRGIAWSVRNRVEHPSWWGKSYSEVITKRWQFSSFNEGDPNALQFPVDDPAWSSCLQAAEDVYGGIIADPTGGATHYYNPAAVKATPKWVEGPPPATFTVQLGDHLFYTGVK